MSIPILKTSLLVSFLAVQVPAASANGKYLCRGTVQANPGTSRISFNLEFAYPQSNPEKYFLIKLKEPRDPKVTTRKAYFSTDGETGYWTIPVTKGVAPIVIARFPAKTEAAASWVAGFSGYSESPVICKPL